MPGQDRKRHLQHVCQVGISILVFASAFHPHLCRLVLCDWLKFRLRFCKCRGQLSCYWFHKMLLLRLSLPASSRHKPSSNQKRVTLIPYSRASSTTAQSTSTAVSSSTEPR